MSAGLPESVGTLGGGNMAEAILRGLIAAGSDPQALIAADPLPERRELLARSLGIRTTDEGAEVVRAVELVVIAVKPQQLEAALGGLPQEPRPLYLSIVAGARVARLRQLLPPGARVVRSMPNTPALVGTGASALATGSGASDADLERASRVLEAVGLVVRVPEPELDAVTGLSGSGPAYVYRVLEGLVEGGVREGLSSQTARILAVQTVLGAARMLEATREEPAQLREKVSSPGGTTLAGLAVLEERGLHEALVAAIRAAAARSRELSRS
ncbi:MAG: pyrroline-5-carboxylate reductase [Myxococcota bacterium]